MRPFYSTGQKKTSSEGITIVYRGMWRHTKGKKIEVAMKTLKCDYRDKYLKDFLDIAGQWAFLQSNAVVKLFGVTLSAQISMIAEYVRFGPLDEYLRKSKHKMKEVDLIEASSNLASALWHLEENGIVHGKIRCRKLLVHNHDENNFAVKLTDPGISSGYPASDVHWIPIECYNNKNYAKHSTPADVWAFGTTLWEIFMFGEVIQKIDHLEAMKMYKSGKRLPKPRHCPQDIYQLMRECWDKDPHRRKQPQAIMRDINQLMYEVYNSRRVHSYAKIDISHSKKSTSSNSLASQETASTFVVDELLSMSDSTELDSDLSAPSKLQNMRHNWPSEEDFSPDDTISEFSNFFQNINLSTATTSLDSINSIQSIFELDGEWNVVLQGKIGQGFYGDVYRATLEKIGDEDYEPRKVAVKKLKKAPELSHLQDFEREISIMKGLKHPNIVEILGVLNEPEISLVMEFVQHGSFQSYLKINKEFLTERQLLKYALDIAMGMAYLGEKKVVHRDLAARNILVVDTNHVKISDFGLAQVVGSNNYYIMKSTRDLPIKWYAPESLEEGKFSTCSDVWSYGVTLWEMFSYGQEPKLAVSDGKKVEGQEQQALLKALQSGARYPCPSMCKQAIYASIIHPCWEYDPHARPTFTTICDQIQLQMKYD
ncbi:Protein tyrosine and serine/threonine kinase [Popillia japonica]|uniref:Protein tyrosine and serine/threonine kinase n=1 Tax=Popillia japonica TaxID=7064 RepID=A0AAW1KJU9_POPJA